MSSPLSSLSSHRQDGNFADPLQNAAGASVLDMLRGTKLHARSKQVLKEIKRLDVEAQVKGTRPTGWLKALDYKPGIPMTMILAAM